ncbi:hypothetical protein SEVIR_7G221275v4 [Setaria viridis]
MGRTYVQLGYIRITWVSSRSPSGAPIRADSPFPSTHLAWHTSDTRAQGDLHDAMGPGHAARRHRFPAVHELGRCRRSGAVRDAPWRAGRAASGATSTGGNLARGETAMGHTWVARAPGSPAATPRPGSRPRLLSARFVLARLLSAHAPCPRGRPCDACAARVAVAA